MTQSITMLLATLILIAVAMSVQDSAEPTAPPFATGQDELLSPPEVYPPSPFDHVVELELSTGDEALDGFGPAQWVDEEISFSGGLHLWAEGESDIALALRVENDNADLIGSDMDSGGGHTPYLNLVVESDTFVHIAVALQDPSGPKAPELVRLHIVAAPETETTRAVARAALLALENVDQMLQGADVETARSLLPQLIEKLRRAEGAHWSDAIASALLQAGSTAYGAGDLISTQSSWKNVRAHLERTLPPDHPRLVDIRFNLAVAMDELGDFAGACALFESVLAVCERTLPKDHPEILLARQNLAVAMNQMGDLAGALRMEESVLLARERSLPEDHPDVLVARLNIAATKQQMGDLAGALRLQESVLAARELTLREDDPDLLLTRENLAVMMKQTGDLAGARLLEENVLAVRERTLPKDHPDILRVQLNLSVTMNEMGDLAGARALLESVLLARERMLPEDHPDILRVRQNLAVTLSQMGDFAGARTLEESVLMAYERFLPKDDSTLLGTQQGLAVTMAQMGDLAGARVLFERVLAARRRTLPKDHPLILSSQLNLAGAMSKTGEQAGARELLESALAAYARTFPRDYPSLLGVQQSLALLMGRMGDLASEHALEKEILAGRERTLPKSHPDLLHARQNFAATILQEGDLAGAQAMLFDLVSGMEESALSVFVLSGRQAREVIAAEKDCVSEALFLSASGSPAQQLAVLELIETRRMVSIEGLHAMASVPRSPRVAELSRASSLAADELNRVVMRAALDGFDPDSFQRASFERDKTQRELRDALMKLGLRLDPVRVETLAARMPKGSVAVGLLAYNLWEQDGETKQLSSGHLHLLAHVVRPDSSFERIELGSIEELTVLVEQWRAAIRKPLIRTNSRGEERGEPLGRESFAGTSDEHEVGVALRKMLLDPILAAAGADVTRLYLCPDDLAYLLPLEALPLGDGVVGDRIRVRVLSSFNDILVTCPTTSAAPSMVVLGGADYSFQGMSPESMFLPAMASPVRRSSTGGALPEQFRPLIQTGLEAESVATLFEHEFQVKPVLLRGADATKARLVECLAGTRFVHLATHGWFAPDSVKSILDQEPETSRGMNTVSFGAEQRVNGLAPLTLCGLALAGANQEPDALGRRPGILTAQEIIGLDLRNCELAVLSACETNVGIKRAGQGIQSLQTALHEAGARWAITSLWKVDDAYTRQLMELFYAYLWKEKLSVPDALWRAKTDLRQAGAPLSAWAPWVLSGA